MLYSCRPRNFVGSFISQETFGKLRVIPRNACEAVFQSRCIGQPMQHGVKRRRAGASIARRSRTACLAGVHAKPPRGHSLVIDAVLDAMLQPACAATRSSTAVHVTCVSTSSRILLKYYHIVCTTAVDLEYHSLHSYLVLHVLFD